jgi:hypothetical protein
MALVLGVLVLGAATGCMRDAEAELVTRDDVLQAFTDTGETLRLRLDMAVADPESPIDVLYQGEPEFKNRVGPFGVVVLESEDATTRHAVSIRAALGGAEEVVVERHKNVVILIYPGVDPDRRTRLLAALRSL